MREAYCAHCFSRTESYAVRCSKCGAYFSPESVTVSGTKPGPVAFRIPVLVPKSLPDEGS